MVSLQLGYQKHSGLVTTSKVTPSCTQAAHSQEMATTPDEARASDSSSAQRPQEPGEREGRCGRP